MQSGDYIFGVSVFQIVFLFIFCYLLWKFFRKIRIRSAEKKFKLVLQLRMVRYIGILTETGDQRLAQEQADRIDFRIAKKLGIKLLNEAETYKVIATAERMGFRNNISEIDLL